jgi:hypothetical protein
VPCPGCGAGTGRVHGYHQRTAADVPVDGRRVVVTARLRRLRCPVLGCRVQTFREQVPGTLERYQRRTARMAGQLAVVARELAGRASARLLPALGIRASRDTALRALLRIPLPPLQVPRVLGIDDFALRRGLVSRPCSSTPRRAGGSTSSPAGPRTPPGTGCGSTRESRSCAVTGLGLWRGCPAGPAVGGAGQ